MAFSKSFPKQVGRVPIWKEVYLTEDEETEQEKAARRKNISVMNECIEEAKRLVRIKGMKTYQSDVVNIAISLFEKRASHQVYWKERMAKEKFDQLVAK